jgi:hypothetical protein
MIGKVGIDEAMPSNWQGPFMGSRLSVRTGLPWAHEPGRGVYIASSLAWSTPQVNPEVLSPFYPEAG